MSRNESIMYVWCYQFKLCWHVSCKTHANHKDKSNSSYPKTAKSQSFPVKKGSNSSRRGRAQWLETKHNTMAVVSTFLLRLNADRKSLKQLKIPSLFYLWDSACINDILTLKVKGQKKISHENGNRSEWESHVRNKQHNKSRKYR